MSRVALTDLDGFIYAVGAISETVYYMVDDLRFDYKSQANKYCEDTGKNLEAIEREVDAEPVSHALNALKITVDAAVSDAKCDVAELYLSPTGKDNFRFDIYPEYKANRDKAHKPVHYAAMRKYAVKHMGAIIADHMEADDIMTIRAYELGMGNWVMITNDKDLKQTAGTFYDWKKKVTVDVSVEEGSRFLYGQILEGDSIDNIKGCKGIGPAKAKKALLHAEGDGEMLEVCKWLYLKAHKFDEVAAMADLKLNIRLVRMLKERPDVPTK
jgi:hypothetical protein